MSTIKTIQQNPLKTAMVLFLTIFLLTIISCKTENKETKATADTLAVLSVHNEAENNNTISAYVNFINSDNNKMKLNHAYTSEALLKLTDATKAIADKSSYAINEDLNQVKDCANKITDDKMATTHADDIRKATDMLSNVLANIQQAKFPALSNEASELKTASSAINPDVLTLQQKDAVKNYFGKAADLLAKMN